MSTKSSEKSEKRLEIERRTTHHRDLVMERHGRPNEAVDLARDGAPEDPPVKRVEQESVELMSVKVHHPRQNNRTHSLQPALGKKSQHLTSVNIKEDTHHTHTSSTD